MTASENVIGAYDAKTHFSAILQRVANGEEFTITHRGVPVARLAPAQPATSAEARREAIRAMRQVASRSQLRGLKVKELIAEGRK
ncbi:MAG: type II toxin-antitoxin system prevent-host-death family antitoxin [Pirellulales bacterium]|nr:type II toxin-antitoxin system prevent-host-death family antitoxin [Pirellulales bacterium]